MGRMPDNGRDPAPPPAWPILRRDAAGAWPGSSPTLVLLHGYGMFRHHLFDQVQHFDRRLTILGIQAPVRIGPGAYRWFNYTRTVDFPASCPGVVIDEAEEAASHAALVAFLGALRAGGAAPVFLLGHSQGGMMSLGIALARPNMIEGCAVLNGRLLSQALARGENGAACRIAFFVGHGVDDATIPVDRGRALRDKLLLLGGVPVYREYGAGHDVTADMLADVGTWLTEQLNRYHAERA